MALESGFSAVPGSPKLASIDAATISYLFGITPQRSTATFFATSHIWLNPPDSEKRRNRQREIPGMAGQFLSLYGVTSASAGTPCLFCKRSESNIPGKILGDASF